MPTGEPAKLCNFIGYCLARAASECLVHIHSCVVMSNHVHLDISDPHGKLPKFKQQFFSMLARGLNALRGRSDSFWSHDGSCDTRRPDEEQSFNDLVYTLTNPVKDGLVKWGHQWPGFTTHSWPFGEGRVFRRPDFFFDPDGDMPDTLTLTLVRPPFRPELDDQELHDELMALVRERELFFQEKMRSENRRFLGVTRLLRQRWDAQSRGGRGYRQRFKRKPTVAASDREIVRAQLRKDREWKRQYACAREKLLAGEDALFPIDTYFLRHFAGVAVATRGSP